MERIGTSTEKTFLPSSPMSPFPAFETFIVNSKGKDVSRLYRAASEVAWPTSLANWSASCTPYNLIILI